MITRKWKVILIKSYSGKYLYKLIMYIINKDSPTLGALLKIYFVWQSDIHSIFRKHRKTSIVRESWKTLWSYIECLSADLDNKAAVSSLFTEIKSDVTADDAQYNLVRFLAKKKKRYF